MRNMKSLYWRRGNDLTIGFESGCDSWAGQIRHIVTNDSQCCNISLEFVAALPRRYAPEMGPATRYALRRNTASIMKI